MKKNKRIVAHSLPRAAADDLSVIVDKAAHLFANRQFDEMRSLLLPVIGRATENTNISSLMGQLSLARGELEVAINHFDKALAVYPDHAELRANRAVCLFHLGQRQEAKAILEEVFDQLSNNVFVLKHLGNIYVEDIEKEKGEEYLRKALLIDPYEVEVLCLLARRLVESSREDEATPLLKQAIKLRPTWPVPFNLFGSAYRNNLRFRTALSFFSYGLKLDPNDANSNVNYGIGLIDVGRLHEAIDHFRRYLEWNPDAHQVRFNLATILLSIGRLNEGWEGYEARRKLHALRDQFVPYSEWDGDSLDGKNIFVLAEQGVGDEILAASMFDDLIAVSGHCIFECDPRLVTIYQRSFPEATVVPRLSDQISYPKEHVADVKTSGMSLARWLRNDFSKFPGKVGYLKPDPARQDFWRWRVKQLGEGIKVGIAWRSMITTGVRRDSYSRLEEWGDIFSVPGVHFINLQYGECQSDIDRAKAMHGVEIANFSDIDLKDGLDDVAALMSQVDLVIAPDNAVAVMAGALNVKALQFVLGKYWSCHGKDYYPWHPSVNLYFRAWDRDWSDPLRSISVELTRLSKNPAAGCSVDDEVELKIIEERVRRGALFLHGGQPEKAMAIFKELLSIKPYLAEAALLLALAQKSLGQPEAALGSINRSIENDPLFADAYNYRGALFLESGSGIDAIRDFEQAIALKPGYPDAFNNLGNALAGQKRYGEAIECYQRAIAGLSGFMLARYNLAMVLEDVDRVDEAMTEYETVVDADPLNADAWNNLANLYGRLLRPDDAIKAYHKALGAKPGLTIAKVNLAKRLLAGRRDIDEAIRWLESAAEDNPGDPVLTNTLGTAYGVKGNLSAAIEQFEKAIAVAPDYVDAHRNLGVALQKSGRLEEAHRVLSKAVQLATGNNTLH